MLTRRVLLAAATIAMASPALAAPPMKGAPPVSVEVIYQASSSAEIQAALKTWSAALRLLFESWWSTLTGALASPGYSPPAIVRIEFTNQLPENVPAATVGARIFVNEPALLVRIHNPDTLYMIAHELVHVVQAYPPNHAQWLAEGIADYFRYYVLLPDDPGRYFDPEGVRADTGYQVTAGLLNWVEHRWPGTVVAINAAMRRGEGGPKTLTQRTGMELPALWSAYMASRPEAANAAVARDRQKQIMQP